MAGETTLGDLIRRAQSGDAAAGDELLQKTYADLRQLAHRRLRGAHHSLLDTTSLVSEWFARFANARGVSIADRAHFLRYAGTAMRTIIVDHLRRRHAHRRGGNAPHQPLDEELVGARAGEEILEVHRALDELAARAPRMAEVVVLRYFGGFTEEETATALGVTERTVRRDWEKARLHLAQALGDPEPGQR
ncbi:MAG TPA: ECF-type sigma factor [Myxococcales bacterium]|nr:ECF-type sigma factor [Myxococcales bacterium]